jgi:hypothetical protein
MATEETMKAQFTAQLRKSPAKGGWNYVIWPESAAFFKTRGLIKGAALPQTRHGRACPGLSQASTS